MTKLASGKEVTTAVWDWKRAPYLEELQSALASLGVFVYENPMWAGSDAYGYIFSKQELTEEEIREAGEPIEY